MFSDKDKCLFSSSTFAAKSFKMVLLLVSSSNTVTAFELVFVLRECDNPFLLYTNM